MLEKLCFKSCAYVSIVVVVVVVVGVVVAVATVVAVVVRIVVVAVVAASHPLCLSNLIYFNVSPSTASHSLPPPLTNTHTDALHISVCAYKRRVLRVRGAWTTTTTTITTCNCEMFIKM